MPFENFGEQQSENQAKLKAFWERYTDEELIESLDNKDPMHDMWGRTPDIGELGGYEPTMQDNIDAINAILEERKK
jgi:hypothetical protein